MLSKQGMASSAVALLAPIDAADTAAATGAWVDVRHYAGEIAVIIQVGVVTAGQVALVIQGATDDQGAGAGTITPNEGAWTTVTTSNDPLLQKRTFDARSTGGYIRVLGTVTTGPVAISASMMAHPRYA